MKELTMPKEVYLEEFDIKVRPYLTADEIISIGGLMIEANNYTEQELTLMVNVLIECTDLTQEDVEDANLDLIIQSGLWRAVENEVTNIYKVWDYVYHEQDMGVAVARFLNLTIPRIADEYLSKLPKDGEWDEVIEKLPKSLNEVLELAKEDGNADIIRGALKMGEIAETGDE